MTHDIERIARGLTEAQRRVVYAGHLYFGRGYWPLYHALMAKGLITSMLGHRLTPLGLAVRAYLKEQEQ